MNWTFHVKLLNLKPWSHTWSEAPVLVTHRIVVIKKVIILIWRIPDDIITVTNYNIWHFKNISSMYMFHPCINSYD